MERRLVLKRKWTSFILQTCKPNGVRGARSNDFNIYKDVPSEFGSLPRLALDDDFDGDAEEESTIRDSRLGIAVIGLLLLVLLL
jgi:hypothetical protein